MRSAPAVAAALAAVGGAAPAHAALLWSFDFSDGVNSATGTLTTNPESSGSYLVTGIAGTYDSATITGLASTGIGAYGASDNLLYPSPEFLDYGGIGFDLASGGPEVLYAPEAGNFFEYDVGTGFAGDFASFSAALKVPEPASAGLFGAALASLALWRRRRG